MSKPDVAAELSALRKDVEELRGALDLRKRIESMNLEARKYEAQRGIYVSTTLNLNEIALRILCSILVGESPIGEKDIRAAFKLAHQFQQVSYDANSSPEPEWLSQ